MEEWSNRNPQEQDDISQCSLRPSESPTGDVVHVDQSGVLHWPVMFLYPEYGQSDFVSDFNECHR